MEIAAQNTITPSLSSQSARHVSAPSSSSNESPHNDSKKAKQAEQAQLQEDQKILQSLRARDQEVRAHEAAHVAAAGKYVSSGPSYTLQRGPDGNSYAIGGEVQLDTSQESDPAASLDKAETVKRAALAPAQPSSQDFSVAASATRSAAQARVDIAVERRNELEAQKTEQEAKAAEAQKNTDSPENAESRQADTSTTASTDTNTNTDSKVSAANKSVSVSGLYSQQSQQLDNSRINQFA